MLPAGTLLDFATAGYGTAPLLGYAEEISSRRRYLRLGMD